MTTIKSRLLKGTLLAVIFFSISLFIFAKNKPIYARVDEGFVDTIQKDQLSSEKWIAGDQEVGGNTRGILDSVGEGLYIKVVGAYKDGQPISIGAIGAVGNLTATLYQYQPVSTAKYVAYLKENFGLTQKAYAQGTGWTAMQPILPIWQLMRNICYLFFVVLFVAIGFMIMFRQKMDAQTVVNIQNALPKIVVSLILVTFSYAIVGLLIDLSQIITMLIANIFKAQFADRIDILISSLTDMTYLKATCLLKGNADCVGNIFTIMMPLVTNLGGMIDVIKIYLGSVPLIGGAAGPVGGILIPLVLGIAILQSIVRIFFMLLSSYVSIILMTILSPFIFLLNTLPGNKGPAGFFKDLLANILIFPVSFLLIILAGILARPPNDWALPLAGIFKANTIKPFEWSPIPLGIFVEPGPGVNQFQAAPLFLNYLIAFGIVMALPKVGEIIKSFMEGGGRVPEIGGGISEGIKGAARHVPIIGGLL